MHLPTILFLGPAAVCVLSWVGAGRAVPIRWLSGERLLDGLTRIAVGSLGWSLVLFALGRLGLFDRWLIVALTIALAVPGALTAMPFVRGLRIRRPRRTLQSALLGATVVALALDLVASAAPPTSADALKYHLALPKLWLQLGSVGDPFWRWEGFSPSGIEMLYAQGLALAGGAAAAPLHAVLGILAGAAVFGLAYELTGRSRAAAAAAFLFVLQGLVTWEATSAFIELGLTFYAVMAVWHALRYWRSSAPSAAAWAGTCAGAAAGTKYLGAVVPALVVGPLWFVAMRKRWVKEALVASAATVASGGAWYLRNVIVAGNPFYPLLFGGKWVTAFSKAEIHATYSDYGVGRNPLRLAILPLELLLHGAAFDRGQYAGTAIFVLAAVALVLRHGRVEIALAGGAVLFLVVWWEDSPQARFLLPALAVFAALGGAAVDRLLMRARPARLAAATLLVCAALPWLVSSAALTRQLLPVVFGVESRAAFLNRLTGTSSALAEIRRRVGPGTLGVAGYDSTYLVPGRAVSLNVTEFDPSLSRSVVLARLSSLDVVAIVVGGSLSATPELDPLRSCLTRESVFHARFVTSRSLGESVPFDFTLYSLAGCRT